MKHTDKLTYLIKIYLPVFVICGFFLCSYILLVLSPPLRCLWERLTSSTFLTSAARSSSIALSFFVTSACTVLLPMPKTFAHSLTVAPLSTIYSPSFTALSSNISAIFLSATVLVYDIRRSERLCTKRSGYPHIDVFSYLSASLFLCRLCRYFHIDIRSYLRAVNF